jgi:lipopolysaccharide/colanic/teichoic acid biosynthesis glycosyltransferase
MRAGDGYQITLHNDDRITRLGKFLRMFKLDELPQLLNILSGDISFVGPRPESTKIVDRNETYFYFLNNIIPGMTDINSIIFKDEGKLFKITDEKMYEEEILPLKSKITEKYGSNISCAEKGLVLLLTILSFIHHGISLRIISFYFLPSEDGEIRNKLNNIFSRQIF